MAGYTLSGWLSGPGAEDRPLVPGPESHKPSEWPAVR
jgi:hypothetical protein